ncbi:MAG: hypothetical protein H6817_02650 [Phycisphaerales bacterium]|nr:hypothetical protein [Phycisphaerales bacterium]
MRILRFGGALCLLLSGVACTPSPGGGNSVRVSLGTEGMFDATAIVASTSAFYDITSQLPTADRISATMSINPADVSITDNGTPVASPVDISLLLFLSDGSADDPCSSSPLFNQFTISVDSNGAMSITPESSAISDTGFGFVDSGEFGLCIVYSADRDVHVEIDAFQIDFAEPGPVAAVSCDEVLALPEVQNALAVLETNGFRLRVPTGDFSTDIEGTYVLSQDTTFDPDGTDIGNTEDGTVTLTNQASGAIDRNGFDASATFFLQGNANSLGFCALERTNDPFCDQTVARLERLVRDEESGSLTGEFLAVAVRRHRFISSTCGARGDFIFGDLSLTSGSDAAMFIARRGKVELPANFEPDLVALPAGGGDGVVTDFATLAALRFDTTTAFTTAELSFPQTVTGDFVAALGISQDDARVALAISNPPRVVTFERATGSLIRSTLVEDPSTLTYLGGQIDFAADATRVYVPGSDTQFADRVNVVRTDNANLPDVSRRLLTPAGYKPVQVRLSPDGAQLAVLLSGGAPDQEAALLTFVNLATQAFVVPPIDLEASVGGTALASELEYSGTGDYIFLAGLGAVWAVATSSPHEITTIDVSSGAGDDPVALAMSGDGAVLAVAIDDATGDADFAVIDAVTLDVLNMQDLPGIGNRRALDVAHFGDQRVALVANLDSTVVAVQTNAPFTADIPVLVADVQDENAIGRVVAAGNLAAVTNTDEHAIYLFESTPQQ